MTRSRTKPPKTERVNLCLTGAAREKLEQIADREDRDLGYIASWFVEWAIQQYLLAGATLVEMKSTKLVRHRQIGKQARERLVLREEAQRQHEHLSGSSPERERQRA